jgi:hypothetical protein
MLHNLRFFSSKCHLFHNATLFCSCIIHILNLKKKFRRQRVKVVKKERKEERKKREVVDSLEETTPTKLLLPLVPCWQQRSLVCRLVSTRILTAFFNVFCIPFVASPKVRARLYGFQNSWFCVISGFRREVEENCALPGYYAASSGQFLTEVSGQHIGPIFKGKNLKMGPTGCIETSVRNWPLLAA